MIEMTLVIPSAGAAALGSLNLVQHRRLHTARHDPLTGLAARQLWTARAERTARHPRGLVILIIDGDNFKQINDRHGHDAGDTLLVAFAQRLRSWTTKRGLAGRLGGDEFAAFVRLPHDARLADELATLSAELSAPVCYRDRPLQAGASIGAALVEELCVPTLHEAMRAADVAMYQAKKAGRGTWHLAEGCVDPFAIEAASPRHIRRDRSDIGGRGAPCLVDRS